MLKEDSAFVPRLYEPVCYEEQTVLSLTHSCQQVRQDESHYNLSSMSLVCFSKNSSLTVPRTVVRMFEHSFHLVRNNKAERPQRPLIKQNELHKKNSPNRGSPQVRLEVVAFLANEVDGVGLKRRVTIELVKQNENYLTPCLPPRNRNTSLFRELKPVFSEEE